MFLIAQLISNLLKKIAFKQTQSQNLSS